MRLEDFPKADGKQVWLTEEEVDMIFNHLTDTEKKIGFGLGARCGLRESEILSVTPTDIVDSGAGKRVRVWHGKGDQYRESPIPESLASTIEAYADVREETPDVPLVDRNPRTFERWCNRMGETLYAETGDKGWTFLTPHDLRRSWGQNLVESDVEYGLIMEWGGWDSWETFREHYLGVYSTKKQKEEVEKVDWL